VKTQRLAKLNSYRSSQHTALEGMHTIVWPEVTNGARTARKNWRDLILSNTSAPHPVVAAVEVAEEVEEEKEAELVPPPWSGIPSLPDATAALLLTPVHVDALKTNVLTLIIHVHEAQAQVQLAVSMLQQFNSNMHIRLKQLEAEEKNSVEKCTTSVKLLTQMAQANGFIFSVPAAVQPRNHDGYMLVVLQNIHNALADQFAVLTQFLSDFDESNPPHEHEVPVVGQHSTVTLDVACAELKMDDPEREAAQQARKSALLSSSVDPCEFYFRTVHQNPEEAGLLMGNLLLAEDRVFSYAVVLMCKQTVYTAFVPSALFYFAAETEAENAIQQIRRWTNGTVAGFIWLFKSRKQFRNLSCLRIPVLFTLVFMQLMMYAIVSISPALWALGLHYSLPVSAHNTQHGKGTSWSATGQPTHECCSFVLSCDCSFFSGASEWYSSLLTLFYLVLYSSFVLLHSRPGPTRLHTSIFHIFTVFNMFVSILPVVAFATTFKSECLEGDEPVWDADLKCLALGGAVVGSACLPFVLAILHDLHNLTPSLLYTQRSGRDNAQSPFRYSLVWTWAGTPVIWEMCCSVLAFYLYLPTKVSVYPAYSFSRCWELTWGNKPSDSLHSLGSSLSAKQVELRRKNMRDSAFVISYSLLAANLFLFILVCELEQQGFFLIGCTVFILLWAMLQMMLTLLWIVLKIGLGALLRFFIAVLTCSFHCCHCCRSEKRRSPHGHLQDGHEGSAYGAITV
jgi:hypothetical protein